MIIALSSIAGLGICAAFGIPFNVLTIQVLPFLLLGLGVDGIFVLTTCHECCIARRIVPSTSPSSSDSAGILTLVQSISVFILFPALLQLDATRRSQKRLDVLCCLRQPDVETAITTNSHRSATT
ncbi:unnamed protein product, partial [Trichobilharzia regenti]